jgi:hypothetical protein
MEHGAKGRDAEAKQQANCNHAANGLALKVTTPA